MGVESGLRSHAAARAVVPSPAAAPGSRSAERSEGSPGSSVLQVAPLCVGAQAAPGDHSGDLNELGFFRVNGTQHSQGAAETRLELRAAGRGSRDGSVGVEQVGAVTRST